MAVPRPSLASVESVLLNFVTSSCATKDGIKHVDKSRKIMKAALLSRLVKFILQWKESYEYFLYVEVLIIAVQKLISRTQTF